MRRRPFARGRPARLRPAEVRRLTDPALALLVGAAIGVLILVVERWAG